MKNVWHCVYPSSTIHTDDRAMTSPPARLETSVSLETLPSVRSLETHLVELVLNPHPIHVMSSRSRGLDVMSSSSDHPTISVLALSSPLLYAASTHLVHVHDSATLTHLHSFNSDNPSSGSVKSISFSKTRVFTAHQDSKIRVWAKTKSHHRLVAVLPTLLDRLVRVPLHNDAVSCVRYSPDTDLLYSVSWDKTLKIWDKSLRCHQSLPAHQDAVNALLVSPDGVVYTGSADSRIRVWAIRPGQNKHTLIATLQRHKSAVNALALSSDASVLFSGASDRSILVWEREDTANYMLLAGALRGHTNAILCLVTVSHFLFSGSADRTIRIWSPAPHYQCFTVLEGHLKPVKSLLATSNSNSHHQQDTQHTTTTSMVTVFSASLDGHIRLWKLNL